MNILQRLKNKLFSKEVCICLIMITVVFAVTCAYLYNKIYELENKLSAQKAESEYMKDLLRTVWQNTNTPTMYLLKNNIEENRIYRNKDE